LRTIGGRAHKDSDHWKSQRDDEVVAELGRYRAAIF
jgi:hypothetical protein